MINMKDLIKQQNQEVRKETGMIKEDTINEINFDKIKLPSVVNRFLDKLFDLDEDFNIMVINNMEVKTLIIVRNVVELLKRLNAAPLFFTRVKFNKLGIMFIDLS